MEADFFKKTKVLKTSMSLDLFIFIFYFKIKVSILHLFD